MFDWRGLLLGAPALAMLVIGLLQGERLNWLNSPLIRMLLGGGGALMALFLLNEWFHPLPFFKIQLLRNRNLKPLAAHAGRRAGGAAGRDPDPFELPGAAARLPATGNRAGAAGHGPAPADRAAAGGRAGNLRRVDCRWVLAAGLGLLALSCALGSQLTPAWSREQFYALEAVQIFAQPMAVIPLLMLATGGLAPQDRPFASAWFNTIKGFAAVAATGLLDALTTWRRHHHSHMLADQLGSFPLKRGWKARPRWRARAGAGHGAHVRRPVPVHGRRGPAAHPAHPLVATRIYPPRAAA